MNDYPFHHASHVAEDTRHRLLHTLDAAMESARIDEVGPFTLDDHPDPLIRTAMAVHWVAGYATQRLEQERTS